MAHYKLEEWADLARGVAKPDRAAKMQGHLHDGCTECAAALAAMKALAAIALRETGYEPPAELVHSAEALLPRKQEFGSRVAEIMELTFDSFVQPAIAGVRGAARAPRQMLFQKGSCSVDIRIEDDSRSKNLTLMGQVLESGETGRGVDTILVQAVKDSKPIASATTNNYGEFRLLLPDAAGVELWIGVSSQNCFLLKVPALDQIPESGQM